MGMRFLLASLKVALGLIGPSVSLLYPLYATVQAMERQSTKDEKHWLSYWIIYSFLSCLELSIWPLITWIPLWPLMKLLFCAWLVLPFFNGAAYLYHNYIRTYLKLSGLVNIT